MWNPTILKVLLLLTSATSALQESQTCWDTAVSQGEMNACAAHEAAKADRELNEVYQRLLAVPDDAFVSDLRAAQRAWLAFRDAHMRTAFRPGPGTGSAYPMCRSLLLQQLTRQRVDQLKALLEREEGDVCATPMKVATVSRGHGCSPGSGTAP